MFFIFCLYQIHLFYFIIHTFYVIFHATWNNLFFLFTYIIIIYKYKHINNLCLTACADHTRVTESCSPELIFHFKPI